MVQHYKTATIFGGTGFVGTQVVRELAKCGILVKVATRVPERAYFLKTCGAVGQVSAVFCDYSDSKSITAAVKGSDYVINCVGILREKGKQRFQKMHVDVPTRIARACADKGVSTLVHISSLGCAEGLSKYAKSKLEGEASVLSNFPAAVILRPSVIFGAGGDFFNKFARMSKLFPLVPFLPLVGGGETKFQPVFVGDVADAIMAVLDNNDAAGQTYELGGPEVLSFKALLERMFEYTKRPVFLMSWPFWFAKFNAFFMGVLPQPPLTMDQVESLKTDNVVSKDALTLSDLGLHAMAMDVILPTYLDRYRPGGRFAEVKSA